MTPAAAPWTDLGAGARVRHSRAWAMNTLVLAGAGHALLVDPGVLPSELDDLARAVAETGAEAVTLVFTHGDWDHVLGRPWWPAARTIGHDGLAGELKRERERILAEARGAAEAAGESWTRGFEPFRPDLEASGLHVAEVGPWHLVLRDARGHSPTMLSLHVPALRLLAAGDLLSDLEIPTLVESPARCRRALEALTPLAEHGAIETLVPGHGAIARGAAAVRSRIAADLAYLDALERDARAAVAAGRTRAEAVERAGAIVHPAADRPGMAEHHRANAGLAYDDAAARSGRAGRARRA